jgi:hypothetical protein
LNKLKWGEELLPDSDSDFALLDFLDAVGDLRLVVAYPFVTKGTTDEAFDGVDDLTGMAGDARECRFPDDGLTGLGVEHYDRGSYAIAFTVVQDSCLSCVWFPDGNG